MQVGLETRPWEGIETEALVSYVFEEKDPVEGRIAELDQKMGRALRKLAQSGELTGKALEMTLLHNPTGLKAQRVLLVLGVLAGFGLKLPPGDSDQQGIELLNANARVAELLENLGAARLFRMTTGSLQLTGAARNGTPAPATPTREEVTRTCLEAHQTLMKMSPENAARFKDVARFLAEDLKSLQKG